MDSVTNELIESCKQATRDHRYEVGKLLTMIRYALQDREMHHDDSKLEPPEIEVFAEYTPRLAATTYGSEEYRQNLREMKVAVDHHQQNNRHHPEFFDEKGIRGMNLVDLVEMICDWKAATLRHSDGNIRRSVEINQQRFGYSDDVKALLLNTVDFLEAGGDH